MTIQIKVTRARYEEVVSIEDDMHFGEMTNRQAYEYITQFVVNEQGQFISQEEARKLFKKVPRKELTNYIKQFMQAILDSYVNPTNGAESSNP